MQTQESTDYTGIDELFAFEQSLPRYNHFIVSLLTGALGGAEKIADFGAGIGTLSLLYRERTGVSPKCVEIDDICRQHLRDRGFDEADSIQAWGEPFDAIFSSNVLEHIEDDIGTLEEIYAALRPGGLLVLYLPAFQVLFSGLDEAVGHYRRYERREIVEKCRRVGFGVERAFYCDSIGFFASMTVRLLGYNRAGGLGTDRSLRIYDRLVFPPSRIADALGFKHLFGKNVFVVARKP